MKLPRSAGLMLKKHPSYNKTLHLASLRAFATSKQEDKKEPNPSKDNDPTLNKSLDEMAKQAPKKLTTAELDEQLRDKMEGRSGEGGEAGVEYEDGKPVAMKRSVKNNMFRLI